LALMYTTYKLNFLQVNLDQEVRNQLAVRAVSTGEEEAAGPADGPGEGEDTPGPSSGSHREKGSP